MHEMITVQGSIHDVSKYTSVISNEDQQSGTCDFCFQKFRFDQEYHYCYYCSIFYCLRCINAHKTAVNEGVCINDKMITIVEKWEVVKEACKRNKSAIVVFASRERLSSRLYLDQLAYLLSSYSQQGKTLPEIYMVDTKRP